MANQGTIKAPSKTAGRSWPSGSLRDVIVVERIDRKDAFNNRELFNEGSTYPNYGRPWPGRNVPGEPERYFTNFSEHVLTYVVEDREDLVCYYASDRVPSDTWNYNVRFSSESIEHPIYDRLYIHRRSTYLPVGELAADPKNPSALCTSEKMVNDAPEVIKSLFVVVQRTYETLPGPILTAYDTDDTGNLVEIDKQEVPLPYTITPPTAGRVQSLQPISVRKAVVTTRTMKNSDGSVPWIPGDEYWEETLLVDENIPGSRVTMRGYYVDRGSTIPDDTDTITYERRRHPDNPALQIEMRKEYAIPDNYSEIVTRGYTFARRFVGLEFDPTNTYAKWEFIPGFSADVPALVEHSFSTTLPTRADLAAFYVREAEWNFPFGFSGRALTDGQAINLYIGGTLVWAGPTLPSSTPSAGAYPSGDEIQISGQAQIYRARIYHIMTVSIIAL